MQDQSGNPFDGGFELIESLLFDKQYFLFERHLARLESSRRHFGFRFRIEDAARYLLDNAPTDADEPMKARLLAGPSGEFRLQFGPVAPAQPMRAGLAGEPVDERDEFLYHKTTRRCAYDRARASRPDVDDVILWNTRGEVTESTIANVVFDLDGALVTPPVCCGLLAGTMRAELLERGEVREKIVYKHEVAGARAIYLINSVRKTIPVQLVP